MRKALATANKALAGKHVEGTKLLSAVKILGKSKKPVSIKPLLYLLCNREESVRLAAAKSLARSGQPQWQTRIQGRDADFQQIAGSDNAYVIKSLVFTLCADPNNMIIREALADADNPLVLEALRNSLTNNTCRNKQILFGLLGDLKDAPAVPSITNYLGNKEYVLDAAEALGKIGDSGAIEALIISLAHEESSIRLAAAEALSHLGESRWKAIIQGDHGDFERLGKSGDQRVFQALEYALYVTGLPDVIKGLAALDNEKVIALLNQAISFGSGPARKAAGEAFSGLGDPFWKDLIIGDNDDFERLAHSGHPRAVALLIRIINNDHMYSDPHLLLELDARQLAWEALSKVRNPDATETLIEALENKENKYHVQINAAKAIGAIGDPNGVEDIAGAIEGYESHYVYEIFKALGTLRRLVEVRYYCEQTRHSDFSVREDAAMSLGELGDPAAIDYLIEGLSEHYGEVRLTIAKALASLGEPEWEKMIHGEDADFLINHMESDYVRMAKSGDPRVLVPLLKVLKEGIMEYRAEAALALGELGELGEPVKDDVLNALKECLCSSDDELRGNAAGALGKLGEPHWQNFVKGYADDFFMLNDSEDPRAFDLLLKTCLEGDPEAKSESLKVLLGTRKPEALDPIIQALGDENTDVRIEAAKTLGSMNHQGVVKPLVRTLNDPLLAVREEAARSLITLAENNFPLLAGSWKEAKEAIETPHEDIRCGGESISSAKCLTHYDTMIHADSGIGLELPPDLKNQ